jgi:hypothetical protein
MSIPPVGWEQNVQHAAAPASPSSGSPLQVESIVPSESNAVLEHSSASTQPIEAPLCHIEDSPLAQTSQVSEFSTARGFLTIVRHGSGPSALYVVTYRRLDHHNLTTKPVLAEGANLLIELLEKLGVNLQLSEVRGALEDVHRLGSANIPDLWINEEQMTERALGQD